MNCPKCNVQMERTEKFRCPGCGAEFDRSDDWISVKVRLPKGCSAGLHKLFNVAVKSDAGRVYSFYAWFDGNEFYCSDAGDNINLFVTHWMPLPEPPKEDE